MKKVLLLVTIIAISLVSSAEAYEVLVVQSARIKPFEDALQGFKAGFDMIPHRGPKSIRSAGITEFVLSEKGNGRTLDSRVRRLDPDLILAIGRDALYQVKDFRDKPVVFLMAPFLETRIKTQPHITGVDMAIPLAAQLAALTEAIPDIKRVGLVYDPERTGDLAAEARRVAEECEITLVAEEVHSAAEVSETIFFDMAGKFDGFWMLPDSTVITPATLTTLLFCALEDQLPILTFSDKYLKHGAALSISSDGYAMGKQAGEMAGRILAGTSISTIPVESPKKVNVRVQQIYTEVTKRVRAVRK